MSEFIIYTSEEGSGCVYHLCGVKSTTLEELKKRCKKNGKNNYRLNLSGLDVVAMDTQEVILNQRHFNAISCETFEDISLH